MVIMKAKTQLRTAKSLDLALDRYERLICLHIANNRCMACGTKDKLQWCHIVPRERKALRWVRANSLILCKDHHYEFDHFLTAPEVTQWVNLHKPGSWPVLQVGIRKPLDMSAADKLALIEMKKEELNKLKEK